ncbi:UdgX family uracil-DNA binding protein [Robbsia andropogonis]|uniref:UdgX family uracil-DNA binding protein n=1 Tax=Robbsia andropogonis TaxID=28092 RepID=UPI0020A032C0|nr:UdgX family uracil-DNA binding protein [Robbsia andropogonis]MCP1118840.1 UdgX family uracil-DNA binding protein [Robbsia andropogonis]MCP1128307.1 UdgX family uracil-DNA binding protein [Robbsia andropogonis]
MHIVTIDNDFGSWRTAARKLIVAGRDPSLIEWRTTDGVDGIPMTSGMAPSINRTLFEDADTFDEGNDANASSEGDVDRAIGADTNPAIDASGNPHAGASPSVGFAVPHDVLKRLRTAARASDPQRWAFLYRVVWRYAHGDHASVLPGDIDGARLSRLARDVSREYHHWRAFLRFQETFESDNTPVLMAWFAPEHDVLKPLAEYFEKRLGRSRWVIASPDGLAHHNGEHVVYDRRARLEPPRPGDDTEALWRTYYQSIFNPARVNLDLTRQHMPARFWKHLPEGDLIQRLAIAAATGQRRHGQADALRGAGGKVITVSAEAAQPQRDVPHDIDACRRCPLWERATQPVRGTGPAGAAIMLLGEQPGDHEDLAGVPFIGPAGELLDRALASAGIQRQTLYLTNAVKHFKWAPRGKRRMHKTPAQREVEACHVWLEQEIAAHQPRVIVTLGTTALSSLTGMRLTLTSMLNKPFEHAGVWIVPTYHPSYALRAIDAAARDDAEQKLTAALTIAHQLAQGVRY